MLTDRGKGLAVAAVLLWLISRAFGIAEVAMAAVAALGLLVLAVLFTRTASARLDVRRRIHPHRLFFDATGSVRIDLRNVGRLPTATLQVDDRVPATITDGGRFILSPLFPGRGVAVHYRVAARQRGRFPIGPLHVSLRDPFGVAERTVRHGAIDEITIYPPVWHLPGGLPLGGHHGAGGDAKPLPMAVGDEFAGVREYVRGDDLRKVHWRTTAHRGKLMVRQDEAPQQPDATVILDTRRDAHSGHGPTSSFELAVACAASVTYHLSSRTYVSRLVTEPTRKPPRAQSWEATLDRLAVIETMTAETLVPLWLQVSQGLLGNGVLVSVVPVPEATELRAMVRAGRGFATRLAVLIDVATFGRRRGDAPDAARTADALRAAGWRVTVLRQGDRLDQRWPELLVHRRDARASLAHTGGGPA